MNSVVKTILIFSGLAILIFFLFEVSQFSLNQATDSTEVIVVIAGLLFIGVGYLINRLMSRKRDYSIEVDKELLKNSELSKQEYKVLTLMADGLTNIEIAERLFIAPSTVKTHVSHILSKLNAKRRTEAVKIGRDLEIL